MNKMKCFLSKKMLLAVVVLLSVGYVQAQEAKDIVLLTLDKALEIALSENPTMKVAGQEIQLKKEAKKEAYGGLFPEVSLTGSYSRTLKKQTMVMDFGGESQTIQVGSDNSVQRRTQCESPCICSDALQEYQSDQDRCGTGC